ncbi:PucR family transcriptional regulator [Nocardia crassostreae]|uniref:PucR family transcriptional regulator n=1 Tax=Nocardia crassostreae TaxID=53428 RepID=UPI0008313E9A|nr:PucR family transcriptional regulator [Nocardia crassostreae]
MLTINRLVADPALGLRITTPELTDRLTAEIGWLHTTELPDPSPYVRSGELVLSNGLWLAHVPAERFVDAVTRAGAAGLVFGLTAQTPELPEGLAALCVSRGLPLVELCIGVPFAAVTRAAARIQNEVLQAELTATVHRGDALATALSRGSGAAGVLEILRGETELPLLVVDRKGRCLASISCEPTDEQIRLAAAALNRMPPPIEVELGAGPAALYLVEGAMGEIDAGLYCLEPVARLGAADREALAQAARFLSLEVTKQQAVQAIEARFAAELLEMILSGPRRSGEVGQRLRAYGVPSDRPLGVFALAVRAAPGGDHPADEIADAAGAFFAARGIPVFTAAGSRDLVAVCPWERTPEELMRFAAEMSAEVGRRTATRVVIGLGEIAAGAGALREPLVRAREVCQVLRAQGGPDTAAFADIATFRMLLGLLDDQVLHRFSDQVLGIIREHDARAHTELEHTLRTFLAHDGQWGVTVAALHVHVNTLRNRMARITELTGRNVNRLEDTVDLFLALAAETAGQRG